MSLRKLLPKMFLALMLWTPMSHATLAGYNVDFRNFSADDFLIITSAEGMIYADSITNEPNVDRWNFTINWEIPNNNIMGTDSFIGDMCLPLNCDSVAGLTFVQTDMKLTGDVFNINNSKIEYSSSNNMFTFYRSVINFEFSTTGLAPLSAKPVPEPATVFLLVLSLMLLSVCGKSTLRFAKS